MDCELCEDSSPRDLVILPIKRADGSLETLACLRCAQDSSAYCKKHQRPHLGFADDDSTACRLCIEEVVASQKLHENAIFSDLMVNLPSEEWERLLGWADQSADITGNTVATCVLRAVATRALRLRTTVDEVVRNIRRTKLVSEILPPWV